MSKLQDFKKKTENMNDQIRKLKLELTMKQKMFGEKQQEKVQLVMSGLGGSVNEKSVDKINEEIKSLESKVLELQERISLYESEINNVLKQDLEALKEERSEIITKSQEKIKELELSLFKSKLEFMKTLEEAGQEQNKLQGELDEYHRIISKFESERRTELETFNIYSPDYLIYELKPPVAPTNNELMKLANPESRDSRLPYSYLVYRNTGEVIPNEKEAYKRYRELTK